MKYIKTYENKSFKKFWLVPTDDRLKDSLREIGCDNQNIYEFLKITRSDKYYYFIYSKENGWEHYTYDKTIFDILIRKGYEYMGAVNIPEFEMVMNKYNL